MKKLIIAAVLFAFAGVFAGQAFAECGPGPLILKRKSSLFQAVAASTNATFFPTYTLGYTINTSGCKSSGLVYHEQESYITAATDNLSQDMARGEGAYLRGLATLMGCEDAAYPEFARMTQKRFDRIFQGENPEPVVLMQRIHGEVKSHPALASRCSWVG